MATIGNKNPAIGATKETIFATTFTIGVKEVNNFAIGSANLENAIFNDSDASICCNCSTVTPLILALCSSLRSPCCS